MYAPSGAPVFTVGADPGIMARMRVTLLLFWEQDVEKRHPYRFSRRNAKMRFPLRFFIQSSAAIEKCQHVPVPGAGCRKSGFFNKLVITHMYIYTLDRGAAGRSVITLFETFR